MSLAAHGIIAVASNTPEKVVDYENIALLYFLGVSKNRKTGVSFLPYMLIVPQAEKANALALLKRKTILLIRHAEIESSKDNTPIIKVSWMHCSRLSHPVWAVTEKSCG